LARPGGGIHYLRQAVSGLLHHNPDTTPAAREPNRRHPAVVFGQVLSKLPGSSFAGRCPALLTCDTADHPVT
jgi:hypothetical protein